MFIEETPAPPAAPPAAATNALVDADVPKASMQGFLALAAEKQALTQQQLRGAPSSSSTLSISKNSNTDKNSEAMHVDVDADIPLTPPVATKTTKIASSSSSSSSTTTTAAAAVLVVLGNMPLDDTTPTVDTMARINVAVDFYHKRQGNCIIVFSGGPTAGRLSEASIMATYARSLGVKQESIFLEEKARNTEENALFSAKLLLDRGILPLVAPALDDKQQQQHQQQQQQQREIFIVSKFDHLEWALPLFKQKKVQAQYFKDAKPLGCHVDVKASIAQMEEYCAKHPKNKMVAHRLDNLKKGVRGID